MTLTPKSSDHVRLDMPFLDVRAFHLAMGNPAPDAPTMLTPERVKQRADFTEEENTEFKDATTLWDQADSAIDKVYLGLGDLVEMGIDPSPLWSIVQAANMAKLGPDGKSVPHPTIPGKIGKPEGWVKPDAWLKAEVERQVRVAEGKGTYSDLFVVSYLDPLA